MEDSSFDLEEEEDPVHSLQWLVDAGIDDAKDKFKRRAKKSSARVAKIFEKLFADIKCGVLDPIVQTKKVAPGQKLRQLFDSHKAVAINECMSKAYNIRDDLHDIFESLFADVKYNVVNPLLQKNKIKYKK